MTEDLVDRMVEVASAHRLDLRNPLNSLPGGEPAAEWCTCGRAVDPDRWVEHAMVEVAGLVRSIKTEYGVKFQDGECVELADLASAEYMTRSFASVNEVVERDVYVGEWRTFP
ncbi:MAG TPA: hypothetical protein VK631_21990 [Solirubrobacteraceae bacterium]|nr:hypothetical protein [Solirubrobacteraceae bacterium]